MSRPAPEPVGLPADVAPLADAELPTVTIVVPCRNERRHVRACIASILAGDYPAHLLDVVVADGASDDGTRAELDAIAAAEPRLRVVDNPARVTPTALNVAIAAAHGAVVVRMDVHAEYPPTYVRTLVTWLLRTGADNVGAAWETVAGASSTEARAIAAALAHPLAVGSAHYRLGVDRPRWVDTVPFGCWRRELFARLGPFDEELVRNQDDEFNHRTIGAGGRILLVPRLAARYHARPTLRQLGRMYYQYGLYKPLAARKLGRVPTLRQLAAPVLCGAVAGLALLAPLSLVPGTAQVGGAAALLLAALLGVYGAVVVATSVRLAARAGLGQLPWLLATFPAIHAAYGLGSWHGLLLLGRRRGARPAWQTALTR